MPASDTKSPVSDFDSNLEAAGSFGKYQLIIILLNCYITAYVGWQAYIPVFATLEIDFYCADDYNASSLVSVSKRSETQVPVLELQEVLENNSTNPPYGSHCPHSCNEYVYEPGYSSIVSDFNLACGSQKFLASFSISAYWVAYFIACFVTGALSDRFGRKYVALGMVAGLAVATTLTYFATDIYLYITLRFICGFCAVCASIDYVNMAEMVNKAYLSKIGMTVQVIFVIGELSCILFGYLFQDNWQLQFVAMAVPCYLYLILHIAIMPESARWLQSQGKIEKAENTLRKIAKMNNKDPSAIHLERSDGGKALPRTSKHQQEAEPLMDDDENNRYHPDSQELHLNQDRRPADESYSPTVQLDKNYSKEAGEPSILCFFGTFHSTVFTLSCTASWFSCSLVYYGLTYDVQNIGGDFYLNNILLTFTEVPAWLVCVAMDIFGRKKTFTTALFICSIACVILPFTEPVLDGNLQIGFAVIGKFLAAGAFDMLYVYTPEQFPTVLRSTGLTFCSAIARIASISAPFIIELDVGPYNCAPFIIFAICGFVASVAVHFFGVETKDKCFITTVEEFQTMAKTKRLRTLETADEEHNQETIDT